MLVVLVVLPRSVEMNVIVTQMAKERRQTIHLCLTVAGDLTGGAIYVQCHSWCLRLWQDCSLGTHVDNDGNAVREAGGRVGPTVNCQITEQLSQTAAI